MKKVVEKIKSEPLPSKYSVPTDEQETVIQVDRNGGAHVYTTDTTWMTKLDKKYPRIKEDFNCGKAIAAYYDVPSGDVKVSPKRKISEEARKAISDRRKGKHIGE